MRALAVWALVLGAAYLITTETVGLLRERVALERLAGFGLFVIASLLWLAIWVDLLDRARVKEERVSDGWRRGRGPD